MIRCFTAPIRLWLSGPIARLMAATLVSAAAAMAGSFSEDFDIDPQARGWRVIGDTNLFQWLPATGALRVTWDSSRENSFFAWPLPVALSKEDDFAFGFDLRLEAHAVGVNAAQPGTFQIAAGFVNLGDVAQTNYVRGTGTGPQNTVEWTWFGAAGPIQASVSPVAIPTNRLGRWAYSDSFVSLETGATYRFALRYRAAEKTAELTMTVDGQPGPELRSLVLPADFTDFRIDALAISSYSAAGQNPRFAGSVLATGIVDRVTLEFPDLPITRIEPRSDGVTFLSLRGWRYVLLASADLAEWSEVMRADGTGERMTLSDPREAVFPQMFFRVRAERP
jgi:hypothetical protein